MRTATIILIMFFATVSLAEEQGQQRGDYFGAIETVHPAWFKQSFLDLEEDIAEAAGEGKRLIVYFWQAGCPYCNRLVEHNFAQKDIVELVRSKFDLVALNMWGDEEVVHVGGKSFSEKNLADALRVQYTPTLLFFDERGKIILRLNGYYPPQEFRLALDYVAEHPEQELAFADYVAAHKPPPAAGELIREKWLLEPPYDLDRSKEQGERPLVVFFEQTQCPNCDLLHRKTLSDAATRNLASGFDSVQLDMRSDTPVTTPEGKSTTAREWARELGIVYAPSLVFFDREGSEVMRSDAFFKTFHLQGAFAYVLEEAYNTETSFQRYLSARGDRLREQGIDVDIWKY
ncbi:MAG: thioredoxin fold domain-containing protein [Pseudomonadota bacterium]|nr:thioredoxin fold domain-containing protein [Pseudomonadota bacterium]